MTLHHRWLTGSYFDKNREVARDVFSTFYNDVGFFSVRDLLGCLSEFELKCKGGSPVNPELGQGCSEHVAFNHLHEYGIWEEGLDGRGTYGIDCDS